MDLRGRGLDACEIVGFEMAKWLVGKVWNCRRPKEFK